MMPAFEVEYAASAHARMPATDEMLMIEPPPESIMLGMANRDVSIMLFRFVVIRRSHSVGTISANLSPRITPTLLSRMSSLPYRSTAESTMARHCSSLVTSA